MKHALALCLCVSVASVDISAQVDGHVSVMADGLPSVDDPTTELRTRVFIERRQDVGEHLRLNLSGYVDALVADRGSDAIARPGDLYAEFAASRFDVRAGASRLVWGRLDELQPTDVVNPIDLTRFLLEGRSEARLPVALVRGRVFLPGSSTLEGVVVPWFRAGRFDQLDEETSPFNLAGPLVHAVAQPAHTWENVQGGARFTSTLRRVDWGVSAYRGFRPFLPYQRFTMIGADFETVRGQWSIRGEAATFDEGSRNFEGGVGVDRRAGDYRLAGNVLVSHQPGDTDVTLVAAADRSFARETRTLRVFTAYDPGDETAFVRGIGAISLRDNVWLEGSAGVFAGSADDVLGRLTDRDFVYARLKVFF